MKILAAFLMFATGLFGDSTAIHFNLQLRPRAEVNKKSLTAEAEAPLFYNALRSRFSITADPSERVRLFLEFQDSRYFGSAPLANGTGDSKNVDLHQGKATVKFGSVELSLGRQAVALGSQRFLSALEWHNVGRSFDGLTASFKNQQQRLNAVALVTRDSLQSKMGDGSALAGLHYAFDVAPALKVETYVFHDRSSLKHSRLYYPGARFSGTAGAFFYDAEYIHQTGTWLGSLKANAFYAASLAGLNFGPHSAALGADVMSGDNKPGDKKFNAYLAQYFFSHAFFGWMDYFVLNPQEGVVDLRAETLWKLTAAWSAALNAHYFLRAAALPASDDAYGSEVDLELRSAPFPKTTVVLGMDAFFPPGDSKVSPEPGYFFYLSPTFNF